MLRSTVASMITVVVVIVPSNLNAQPSDYYSSVDLTTPATTRATLHAIIDDHQRYPYTSTATDTWDILELADEHPGMPTNILDVYLNASYAKAGGGNPDYNREHTWPNSYGYPDNVASNYPYTDTHALFLCDGGYNSSRGNTLYRDCPLPCDERVTIFNNDTGGGSGVYPGNSNWRMGVGTTGSWQVWLERKGDVARGLLYLDVRYDGSNHSITGADEPDLILTDDVSLITTVATNVEVAHMGLLSTLLQWHIDDPVSEDELVRHEVVFTFQGNRNPFIDNSNWVQCVYSANGCGHIFSDGFESGDLSEWEVFDEPGGMEIAGGTS